MFYCFMFFYFNNFKKLFLGLALYCNSASTMLVLHFWFLCYCTTYDWNAHWTVCRQLSDSETHRHCWYFAEIWRLLWFGHRMTRSRRCSWQWPFPFSLEFPNFQTYFCKVPLQMLLARSVTSIFSFVINKMLGLYLVPTRLRMTNQQSTIAYC